MRKAETFILVILILLNIAVGILTNVASSVLPDSWVSYLWLSWPALIILSLILIAITFWQSSLQRRNDKHGNYILKQNQPLQFQISNHNNSLGEENMEQPIEELRTKLLERASLGDLKDMCFIMGVDYDNYPSPKKDFVRDFLRDLNQQNRVNELVTIVQKEKPWVLR